MVSAEPTAKAGWEVKTLGELTQQRPICYGVLKPGERQQNGVPLIRVTDISSDFVNESKLYLITEELSNEFRRSILKGGEVLLSIQGTIGRTAICPEHLQGANISRTIAVIEPDDRINRAFLRYWLLSMDGTFPVTGSTRASLNIGAIRELNVPVPPLAAQERIVGILDEAFEGIAAATAQAEKNLHNARELFQSVLQSTFSQKGDDWVETTLGEVCELISGQHILAGDYNTVQKGIGYLTGPSDFGELNPIVSRWTEKPKSTAKSDDILITVKGSGVGKINLLAEEEIAISRQLMAIRLNDTVSLKFIYFFMSMQFAFFQDLSTGAAIPGISRKDVLNLVLNLPPLPTQQAIVEKLDALSEETKALEAIYERKQSALAELKQSLLQKAFAGEL